MKQSLKNKLSTIRGKIDDLIEDLNNRVCDLEDRDDPEGIWEEEMDEINQLIDVLDQANMELEEYDY